jgi:hypothetical protein
VQQKLSFDFLSICDSHLQVHLPPDARHAVFVDNNVYFDYVQPHAELCGA